MGEAAPKNVSLYVPEPHPSTPNAVPARAGEGQPPPSNRAQNACSPCQEQATCTVPGNPVWDVRGPYLPIGVTADLWRPRVAL